MEEDETAHIPVASQPKCVPNEQRSYKCQVCGESFESARALVQHLWIHTGDKPFRCDQCSCCFEHLADLHQHKLEKHNVEVKCGEKKLIASTNERQFRCDYCGNSYKNSRDLRKHQRLKHQEVKDEGEEITVTLNEEPQIYNSTNNSTSHWTYKESDFCHECKHCGKGFPNPRRLLIHERIHEHIREGKRVYKCKYCGTEFTSVGNLRSHEMKHKRELQIKCGRCGKKCANVEKLKSHKCALDKERYTLLFMCSHCEMTFSSRNELTIHQLQYSHIGEKSPIKKHKRTSDTGNSDISDHSPKAPLSVKTEETSAQTPSKDDVVKDIKKYKCDHCEKRFKSTCHLKEHTYIHVGKPYKCVLCGLEFVRCNQLERHHCRFKTSPKQSDVNVKTHNKPPLPARLQQRHNKERYKCEECVQNFAYYNNFLVHNLTVHGKTAKDEPPYEPNNKSTDKPSEHNCTDCGKNFMDPSSFNIHKCDNQSTEKTLTCQDCGTVVKVRNTTLSNVFTLTNLSNVKCFVNNHTLL